MEIDKNKEEMIINFGAFHYSPEKMSNILGWKVEDINELLKDKESQFAKLYDKGKDTADYVIDLKLFELAQTGDLKALEKFEDRQNEN